MKANGNETMKINHPHWAIVQHPGQTPERKRLPACPIEQVPILRDLRSLNKGALIAVTDSLAGELIVWSIADVEAHARYIQNQK